MTFHIYHFFYIYVYNYLMNFDRAWCQWYTKMKGNVGRWIFLH